MAEPWVSTISIPRTNRISMIGANHNFLRCFRKAHKSLISSSIKLLAPSIAKPLFSIPLRLDELLFKVGIGV